MELKSCPNCKKRTSENDVQCPYCKYIDDKKYKKENDKLKEKQLEEKNVTSKVNYCFNCGARLEKDYCSNCGMQVLNNETVSEKDGSGKVYIIICLSASILSLAIFLRNFNVAVVLNIFSLLVIILGKQKHPKNTTINVIYWICLVLRILDLICCILLLMLCNSCKTLA